MEEVRSAAVVREARPAACFHELLLPPLPRPYVVRGRAERRSRAEADWLRICPCNDWEGARAARGEMGEQG